MIVVIDIYNAGSAILCRHPQRIKQVPIVHSRKPCGSMSSACCSVSVLFYARLKSYSSGLYCLQIYYFPATNRSVSTRKVLNINSIYPKCLISYTSLLVLLYDVLVSKHRFDLFTSFLPFCCSLQTPFAVPPLEAGLSGSISAVATAELMLLSSFCFFFSSCSATVRSTTSCSW